MNYTQLRDFLDGYTSPDGVIQGDPATIAAEAVSAGIVGRDEEHDRQHAPAPPDSMSIRETGRPASSLSLSELRTRLTQAEWAILQVDFMLTTVEGDNIPQGESPKLHCREIARNYMREHGIVRYR